MQFQRYLNRVDSEDGNSAVSSRQKRQAQKIQLPYKLLKFPSSKCNLWDHNAVGDTISLQLFCQRQPKVKIGSGIIKKGHHSFASRKSLENEFSCTMCGKVLFLESENETSLAFNKLKCDKDHLRQYIQQCNSDYNIPIHFSEIESKDVEVNFHQEFKEHAMIWLQKSIQRKEAVVLTNFILCKAHCQFKDCIDTINFDLIFLLGTLEAKFTLKPILPIPVILTALSKGLSDPLGNTFLHGEPKSGYVTMDELRRLLLVLDSDPKVASLPLVGIWVGGVLTVKHPFVWASCVRYLHNVAIQDRVCSPPSPFLVLVYEKTTFKPQFYNCFLESSSPNTDFVMYSGKCSSVLDQTEIDFQEDDSELQSSTNVNLKFKLTLMDDRPTPCQKLSFSPSTTNSEFKANGGSNSPNLNSSPVSDIPSGNSKENYCSCSCRNHDKCSDEDARISKAISPQITSPPCCSREGSEIPNQNLYGLLLAQEKQLKQLKEQLDDLLRQRQNNVSVPLDGSPKNNAPSPISVNSAGTMTSLAWPTPSSTVNNQFQCHQQAELVHNDESSPEEEQFYPEIERRQASTNKFQSTLNSMADSLANIQLPNFEETAESRQSSIIVDIHDYAESFTSSYLPEQSAVLGESCSMFESTGPSQVSTPSQAAEDDSSFYGNLLKKIQTILSQQESPIDNFQSTEAHISILPSIQRSNFESLLIPHLNYLSMLPNDLTTDQSLEFQSLARKYLGKKPSQILPIGSGLMVNRNAMTSLLGFGNGTESNFSFASRRYLEKHGLNGGDQ